MTQESNKRIAAALAASIALAIPAEGIRRAWYVDPASIVTVCYGHTGSVDKTKTYSLAECKALLNKDMLNAIETVDRCRPGLPTEVLAAFADAAYNLGPTIACDTKRSTAARYLAAGDYAAACRQLGRWVFANVGGFQVVLPGLVKRRAAETELCLKGVA